MRYDFNDSVLPRAVMMFTGILSERYILYKLFQLIIDIILDYPSIVLSLPCFQVETEWARLVNILIYSLLYVCILLLFAVTLGLFVSSRASRL